MKSLEETAQGQPLPELVSERENNKLSEQKWLLARLKELNDNVKRVAGKVDLSEAPAAQVLDWHWTATKVLEALKREVFQWFRKEWSSFLDNGELRSRALRVLENGLQLAEEVMAKQLAAYTEIYKRVHKNEINYQFGQLLIAHQTGDLPKATRSYGRLKRILLSIPYSRPLIL